MTGTGKFRTVNKWHDGDLWHAVTCSLGLFGILTKITLSLQLDFNVRMTNHKIKMQQAIDEVVQTFKAHDYAQYFWFPFNRKVMLQTSDVTNKAVIWRNSHQRWKT